QEQARRVAEAQKQREAELARARTLLDEQHRRQENDAQAQRKAQEARDQAAAAKFIEEGKALLAQGKFDAAVTSFQAAQRLHKTSEVDGLIAQASEKAAAVKQDAKAKADKLFHTDAVLNGMRQVKEAQDKDRAAAELARQKQLQQQQQAAAVQQLLNSGRTALAAGQLDAAAKAFAEAKKLAPDNAEVLK